MCIYFSAFIQALFLLTELFGSSELDQILNQQELSLEPGGIGILPLIGAVHTGIHACLLRFLSGT